MKGTSNPAFQKFTEKNWTVVAALENVANQLGRSMAQVAVNWVANRPGVGSVILGATKLNQLEDNLQALDFEIPAELRERLNAASALEPRFPYTFFIPEMQAMLTGGTVVADKPAFYHERTIIDAKPTGVQ